MAIIMLYGLPLEWHSQIICLQYSSVVLRSAWSAEPRLAKAACVNMLLCSSPSMMIVLVVMMQRRQLQDIACSALGITHSDSWAME